MKFLTHGRVRLSVGQSGWVAITNYASVGLFFIASVFSARLLGAEGRGELAAIQNWALFAVMIGTLGIPVAAAYFAGNRPDQSTQVFVTALIILVILALPVTFIMYIVLPQLMPSQDAEVIQNARIFLLLVPIQFTLQLPYYVILGLNRLKLWNIVRLQLPILWLMVFVVGYIQGTLTASFAARGYLVVSFLHGITWMIVMVVVVKGSYRPSSHWIAPLFRYGLPSALGSAPRQLNLRGDQLLMAALMPAEMLGLYVVAVAWSGLLQPMTSAFAQTVFPSLASSHIKADQKAVLRHTLRLSILISVLFGAMMLAVTPLVIPLVYGQDFSQSIYAALILVIASVVAGVNNVLEDAFRGLGIPKWPMTAEIIGLCCTVLLLLVLLPRYQLMGAAVASLISYAAVFVVLAVFLRLWTSESLRHYLLPDQNDLHVALDRFRAMLTL